MYDIWQARCDVPSEWDGGGQCVETVDTFSEAVRALKDLQIRGHAAWVVSHDEHCEISVFIDKEIPLTIKLAILELDPDGGWDSEKSNGWPSNLLYRDLQKAVDIGLVEKSSAYGNMCWRLTDEGIYVRRIIDRKK